MFGKVQSSHYICFVNRILIHFKTLVMTGNLVWVAFDMFREYYISVKDGSVYVVEGIPFNPKKCDNIPEHAEYITYPVSAARFMKHA
jgi:hypothetical protein